MKSFFSFTALIATCFAGFAAYWYKKSDENPSDSLSDDGLEPIRADLDSFLGEATVVAGSDINFEEANDAASDSTFNSIVFLDEMQRQVNVMKEINQRLQHKIEVKVHNYERKLKARKSEFESRVRHCMEEAELKLRKSLAQKDHEISLWKSCVSDMEKNLKKVKQQLIIERELRLKLETERAILTQVTSTNPNEFQSYPTGHTVL